MEYSKELNVLIPLLKDIGKEIMQIYNTDFSHELKDDKSPLTEADLLSDKLLVEKLSKEFPEYGIISEEFENHPQVYSKEKIWILDPLDGTKDFVQKTGEFSIMVALLENRKPILGVVYAPALDKFYFAQKGLGAFLIEGDIEKKLNVSDKCDVDKFTLIRSRNHFSETDENLCKNLEINNFIKSGSVGIKFGKIAEKIGDLCYYTTDKMGIWDDAAAHVILKEAGGDVFDMRGKEPEYDLEGRKMKYGFIGTNGKVDRNVILEHLN